MDETALAFSEDIEFSGERKLLIRCLLTQILDYLTAKALVGSDAAILREAQMIEKSKHHRSKAYGTAMVGDYLAKYKRTQAQRRIIKRGAEAIEYINFPVNTEEAQGHIFSFYNICTLIGLDHTKLRDRIMAYTPEQIKENLSSRGFEGFEWRA